MSEIDIDYFGRFAGILAYLRHFGPIKSKRGAAEGISTRQKRLGE
jgi:hypothetical protein